MAHGIWFRHGQSRAQLLVIRSTSARAMGDGVPVKQSRDPVETIYIYQGHTISIM